MTGRLRPFAPQLMLAAILLFTFAVYAPTLDDWFQADDFWFLRASQTTPAGEYAVEAFDFRDTEPVPAFRFYRPLYLISFRFAYALFGLNALGYHALNVALHLGSVTLVWFIAKRLTRLPTAASLAALIFALHPAYANTVAWVARGNTIMVTFVYLLSFLLFMKYMEGGRRSLVYYLGALLGFMVAVLYHPTAISLAAALPAYVFLVSRKPADALQARSWLPLMPFVLIAATMVGLQMWVRGEVGLEEDFLFGWHQFSRFREYLGLALLPIFRADLERADVSLFDLLSALQWVASFAMIGIALVLLMRRRWPYAGVFAAWWLITSLAPNSTLATYRAIPAQLYLPGVSLAIFFVLLLLRAKQALPPSVLRPATRAAPIALATVALLFVVLGLSHQQAADENSAANRAFIAELRANVPPLEPGGILYVANAPFNLILFDDSPLDAMVELYYGKADVRSVRADQVAEIESVLGPKDRLFHYRPNAGSMSPPRQGTSITP